MKKEMMKFIKGLVLVFFVAAIAPSCTDLEEEFFDVILEDNFFKTPEEFAAAAGAAYTPLTGAFGHNGYYSLQEVSSDEMIIPTRGGDWFDGGQWLRVHTHDYNSREESVNNTWNLAFEGVNAANRLIEQFEPIEGSELIIAEFKVMRAFYYHWLLDVYGNVPLVERLGESQGQKTRAEIYAFVDSELKTNVPLLSKNRLYGRINYYGGRALQAKLALNSGVYLGTGDPTTAALQDVITYTTDIIDNGPYSLASSYFDVFSATNDDNEEHIFVVPYDQVFITGFPLNQMTLHYGSQNTYNLTAQPWNGYCTLQEFYNSYDDTDLRKNTNFVEGPQYFADGVTPVDDPSVEDNDPDGPQVNFTPDINEHFPNALRQAGVRVGKFEIELGATPDKNNDFPIFRLGDVILMLAEAEFRLGNTGTAATLVDQIRARAGLGSIGVLTSDLLLEERGREMFSETSRRTDLIRFGVYNDGWEFNPADPDDHVNIYPIPDAQINVANLTQNPGYN
jgi:starch-binding outer membrane protein, SusD/RagB family